MSFHPVREPAVMDGAMSDGYFESMYDGDPDPWGFDTRFYERRKFDLTVAALPRERYRAAFEPGCSNGALTELLAARCDRLTSCDIIAAAVERACDRVRDHAGVTVLEARFPDFWPDGPLDLVVWSEVAYYLDEALLVRALDELDRRLSDDGDLVVVNYTGDTNYPRTADDVDAQIEARGTFERRTSLRDELFRLDVWQRRPSDPHSDPMPG